MKGIKFNKIDADIQHTREVIKEVEKSLELIDKEKSPMNWNLLNLQQQINILGLEMLKLKKKVEKC